MTDLGSACVGKGLGCWPAVLRVMQGRQPDVMGARIGITQIQIILDMQRDQIGR